MILAVIPARSGSKRLPKKNVRQLGGKTLIEWTILAAKGSKYLDKIILSSDKAEWRIYADRYGIDFDLRPPELATDESSVESCVRRILWKEKPYDFVILLQPTSPLRTTEDIDSAVECFLHRNDRLISFRVNNTFSKNGAIYICRSDILLEGESFSESDGARIFLMPDERSIDIDTIEDWNMAEAIYENTHRKLR